MPVAQTQSAKMSFSQEQLDQLRAGIDRTLASGRPNDWEQQFLRDMRARLDRYDTKTRLSDKQYQRLMLLVRPQPVGPTQSASSDERRASDRPPIRPSAAVRQTTRSNFRPAFRVRRRSWFGNRIRRGVRNIRLLLVLGLAVALFQIVGFETERTQSVSGSATSQENAPGIVAATGPSAISAGSITVVDGDTISLSGYTKRIRLVGFNTPEVFSPQCNRELQAGKRATVRLKELLRTAGTIEFQRVACSCKPGTEGTPACNHGRLCGSLLVDGRNVGDILIGEGLAARYRCSPTSCPPPPGNWCG